MGMTMSTGMTMGMGIMGTIIMITGMIIMRTTRMSTIIGGAITTTRMT